MTDGKDGGEFMTPEEQKALTEDYYKNLENLGLELEMLIEHLKEKYPDIPPDVQKKLLLEIVKKEASRRSLPPPD
jgi:dsRNA-specific ribonuclease